MNDFLAWFTPERRKAIYTAVAAIGALLLAFGVISDADVTKITDITGQIFTILGCIMAVANTNTDGGTKEFKDGSDI